MLLYKEIQEIIDQFNNCPDDVDIKISLGTLRRWCETSTHDNESIDLLYRTLEIKEDCCPAEIPIINNLENDINFYLGSR
jgi:hypothetical protein